MRKKLGLLSFVLLASTLTVQAQNPLLKELEQNGVLRSTGLGGGTLDFSNDASADPAGNITKGNLTETLGKELSELILAKCRKRGAVLTGSGYVERTYQDFDLLISNENLDPVRVWAVISKDSCVKALSVSIAASYDQPELRNLSRQYQKVTGAELNHGSYRPLFTAFLSKLGSTESSEFKLFSSELAAYADSVPYREFLAQHKRQQEKKVIADKALGGDFSGVKGCAEVFAGGKIDFSEQPTLEPTNELRANLATFVRYDPPVGFLMTATNPIKFIAPKGKGKVWFNKERTKLNLPLLVIGKYIKNEKVMMTSGQEVLVPVLEAWCIEQMG